MREAPEPEPVAEAVKVPVAGSIVPHFGQGMTVQTLAADYRRIVELVESAPEGGEGAMAKDIASGLGLELVPAKIEGVRSRARRLAERGWLAVSLTEVRDNAVYLSVDDIGVSLRQRIAYTETSLPSPAVAAPTAASPRRPVGRPPAWWEEQRASGWSGNRAEVSTGACSPSAPLPLRNPPQPSPRPAQVRLRSAPPSAGDNRNASTSSTIRAPSTRGSSTHTGFLIDVACDSGRYAIVHHYERIDPAVAVS